MPAKLETNDTFRYPQEVLKYHLSDTVAVSYSVRQPNIKLWGISWWHEELKLCEKDE